MPITGNKRMRRAHYNEIPGFLKKLEAERAALQSKPISFNRKSTAWKENVRKPHKLGRFSPESLALLARRIKVIGKRKWRNFRLSQNRRAA